MDFSSINTKIRTIGKPKILSPILNTKIAEQGQYFISDNDKVLIDLNPDNIKQLLIKGKTPASFEIAGPKRNIYFDPSKLRCALVTCGGLCPGLNDVIRSIVLELYHRYNVSNIYGICYGLQGFIPKYGHKVMQLAPEVVSDILNAGGSILGSSRGPQNIEEIVDSIERMNIGILFMIGGDGTLKAAGKIADAVNNRGLKISVVGIPKTIDNDIYLVSRSFGFETAVEVATQSIKAAHNEARGYPNGIGLIKLMGRHSGFIAATGTLAQQDVNFVLIPEIDFDLQGYGGLLSELEKRLSQRKHAVIIVAEGAGQKFFKNREKESDASGNMKLNDIGLFLKQEIADYFKSKHIDITLKYIDPSYIIRSLPANANDSVFCGFLGRYAVHAGMAGKTKLLIGHRNDHFVHIPIESATFARKQVMPHEELWHTVLEATGQGNLMTKARRSEEGGE